MTDPLPDPANLPFVEEVYELYRRDPASVDERWRRWFSQQENGQHGSGNGHVALGPRFRPTSIFAPAGGAIDAAQRRVALLQHQVDKLVRAYRVRGHLAAQLDPLGLPRPPQPELDPAFHGLDGELGGVLFSSRTMAGFAGERPTLDQILERLRNTYCRSIGVQFMHIDELQPKNWLQDRMEGSENRLSLSREQQLRILTKLTDAVIFEEFIHKQYLGAKRFSLEGGESLVPLLDLAIEKAGEQGIDDVVLGMAHRGRINVLANVVGKPARTIFREFDDRDPAANMGRGDVKYHLGYSNDVQTATGQRVHLSMCFNPSHLEFVNPVAQGRVRAKQDRREDHDRQKAMCLLVHGDAAFAGEGVVQETLNLSQLHGYHVGGTIHVIVNNQIGFTTPPEEARSSTYCSAVAKMLASPIFHVNGEDPEAVAQVINLAMDFRREFRRDVVIDMYCYRRYGHNEGDEAAFTQPLLYDAIKRRKTVRQGYLEHVLAHGDITRDEADGIWESRKHQLETELTEARGGNGAATARPDLPLARLWGQYRGGDDVDTPDLDTALEPEQASRLLHSLSVVPTNFGPHPKIRRFLAERAEMAEGHRPLNWAAGEALALASLSVDGVRVRFTGQDSVRGTFSHRHAILYDPRNGSGYFPLRHVVGGPNGQAGDGQGSVEIYNSPLSEAGVLGFEYGYSLDMPDALTLWEAQFGDFHNVAQVIVDQFLVSAEDKWDRLSGLVLLLPHGFEGMGPEHSSARLERFLMLAAEDNIQIAYPTTPAQYFHLLRRQVVRVWRKPLVVMTPKSLLRHPRAQSDLGDCCRGGFQRILPDPAIDASKARRVVLCTGKVYYDLLEHREREQIEDIALLRFEQLYPLADEAVEKALAPFAEGTDVVWVQEEPENAGAWRHFLVRFGPRILGRWPLRGLSRPASASPATGSLASHRIEQAELVEAAFAD